MADNLSAFIEAVAADPALQEKLNSVADADAVVAIAKEAGFVISAEEMEKMENSEEELNAEQLAAVAGGFVRGAVGNSWSWSSWLAANYGNKRAGKNRGFGWW
jgi:predicted ribosomally synthesized peptide with nif11-like leader